MNARHVTEAPRAWGGAWLGARARVHGVRTGTAVGRSVDNLALLKVVGRPPALHAALCVLARVVAAARTAATSARPTVEARLPRLVPAGGAKGGAVAALRRPASGEALPRRPFDRASRDVPAGAHDATDAGLVEDWS